MSYTKEEIALLDEFVKAHLANNGDPSVAYTAALAVLEQRRALLTTPAPAPTVEPEYPAPTDWIEWTGGKRPVAPYVVVELDWGDQMSILPASEVQWDRGGYKYRIVEKSE